MLNTSGLKVLGMAALAALSLSPSMAQNANQNWIAAWSTSQQGLSQAKLSNATVRMIARVTIPGDAVRIRLDNTFGKTPLTIAHATLAPRVRGAAVAVGQVKPISFGGKASVTIPAGGTVESDAVAMHVDAQQDVAVSMFVPASDVQPSQHGNAQTTSYITDSGRGDQVMSEDGKVFEGKTTAMYWLKSIDVRGAPGASAIVAFGDSITDGTCSTVDAHDRWEDVLAVRLALDAAGRGNNAAHKAVVNEGIGGNTITREHLQPPPDSPPGLERFERDVLAHHGVTHMLLFMGTNDIRRGASASQVIAGMQELARRAKARGLKTIGVTIIPRHNRPPEPNNTGWDPAKTQVRHEVNQWIRTKAPFDGVIDFDNVVQDPKNADLLLPAFNCGDGIHPSPRGYYEMGRSVRLGLFQ